MVFDATTKAFNLSGPAHDRSSDPSTSAVPTPPTGIARPVKRRRTTQPRTMSSTPTSSPAPTPVIDLDALDAARRRASSRVMSLWESLAEKYARPIEEDDEIDILTGKICKDRGVLRSVSERGWKIGSFGEALEVEPLVLVSEGETETGASEADDEGEGDDDTEGEGTEGVEGTEEVEEDPLGSWSYDWQYRALPPPRPELSPQDAEDLKEFLAAENAIRESLRKSGKRPESDDDDIVYLGDSLHNTDGTLRNDETSDDEFASMVMTDNSTIRYMKYEDDDDELDDVEPMASILGALALSRTPKKQTSVLSTRQPKDEDMDSKHVPLLTSPQDNNANRNHPDVGSQASAIRSPPGISCANSCSGISADDDLIVIDSDSDDEPGPTNNSGLKSEISAGSFSQHVAPPANTPISSVQARHRPSNIPTVGSAVALSNDHSPAVRLNRLSRTPVAGAASLLNSSTAQHRSPKSLPGSPTGNSLVTGNAWEQILDWDNATKKPLSKTGSEEMQTVAARQSSSSHRGARSSKPSTSTPTTSPSSQSKSPIKRTKKAVVVEVVLPTPRKAPKVKTELTTPSLPLTPKDKGLDTARTASNERSHLESNGSARGSEQPVPAPASSYTKVNSLLIVRSGVESGSKRKRSLDGAELTESADSSLEPRGNIILMEPRAAPHHTCYSSDSIERNRPAICCSTHPQQYSGLYSHAPVPSQPAHTHSTHHYPNLPVYQHQHQHQHLHTHLPYPLPQLPFTANELTEAAFKLIHGLSTFHQPSGTTAHLDLDLAFAGPSSEALAPKLEEPPSQEKMSNEFIPSSQEHERKAETLCMPLDEKPSKLVSTGSNQTAPSLPYPKNLALATPNSSLGRDTYNDETAGLSAVTPPDSLNSEMKVPEREMSVIDIDSDSDDELANATLERAR
ncbi:Centromere protein Scm3 [Rhizoctonia solani]|uniref:Centromere protein Scm3 n=1 Tax=Rhizoctonia solani TaxID=456999 RepID=A0A8H7IG11_9AGAM|nr:Centromere protein Scm3 [Rhizoctonia solani]